MCIRDSQYCTNERAFKPEGSAIQYVLFGQMQRQQGGSQVISTYLIAQYRALDVYKRQSLGDIPV